MKTSTFLSLSTTVLFGVLDFSSATSPPPPGYYHREGHGKPGHPKSGYPTRTYPYNLGTGAPIIRTQPPEYTKPWETPVPRTGYELQPDVAHPYPPADPNVSIDDPSNLFDPYFPGIVIDFPDTNLIVDPVDNNDYQNPPDEVPAEYNDGFEDIRQELEAAFPQLDDVLPPSKNREDNYQFEPVSPVYTSEPSATGTKVITIIYPPARHHQTTLATVARSALGSPIGPYVYNFPLATSSASSP